MDYSSYSQQEDQQYQQYLQQYQQHEQQQQPYASSQFQAYDNSSQAYYSYGHHQQYDNQYPYYHSSQDYANSYAQQTHQQFLQEPTSVHPPGVPIPPELEQNQLQNHQNAYYPHGVVGNQQQMGPGSDSDPAAGLNPAAAAAVAAFSQLTQFAGNMDATQRAMRPLIGQTSYRGRRGNRPFRGGRSHFGQHAPRPDGSAPSFRGRGRGQGGSRHFRSHGAVSKNSNMASAALAEGVAASMQPPSASVPGQAPLPVPAQVPPTPFWRPPRIAWCELCRVDCNTLEILEQHKNGKRHKKNLQVFEELQKLNKVIPGHQNAQMRDTEIKSDIDIAQPEKVEGNQPLSEKTSDVMTNDNSNETEQKCDSVDNSEASAKLERKQKDQFPARGRGYKRKLRGGRGGKFMRANEGSKRPVEPPKPKQVIPLICELCNVKCESQVVFDSHLIGKKHQANLKRFHGHRALYGEAALQALYPPNFNAPSTSLIPQGQQGVNDPQVLLAQLLMNYVLSQTQAQGMAGAAPTMAPASAVAAPEPAPGSSNGAQNQPDSHSQGTELRSEDGSQNALMEETKSQLQTLITQSEAAPAEDSDSKTVDETSQIATKNVHVYLANTVKSSGASEQVSGTVSDKAFFSQQEEVVSSDLVFQPE